MVLSFPFGLLVSLSHRDKRKSAIKVLIGIAIFWDASARRSFAVHMML
jgi:hypothetical protein